MLKADFNNPGPQLASYYCGREPSLRELLHRYYEEFFSEDEVEVLVQEYIDAWVEEHGRE